ncbi:hypothetical protein RFI_22561 [Reticulomyxa filosa]|uniref:Uncharacterized protein n=1 Tax=Reticulomyxa filosa TaxID=46433 RepID=X6MMD6_RETFI|nr:hypothetical protein RFI_22561 [Reticulomyxa filosa]|eukprot:ETO14806.1 hypothetical protein RFI_22561 [Reticulomyxa filosa]
MHSFLSDQHLDNVISLPFFVKTANVKPTPTQSKVQFKKKHKKNAKQCAHNTFNGTYTGIPPINAISGQRQWGRKGRITENVEVRVLSPVHKTNTFYKSVEEKPLPMEKYSKTNESRKIKLMDTDRKNREDSVSPSQRSCLIDRSGANKPLNNKFCVQCDINTFTQNAVAQHTQKSPINWCVSFYILDYLKNID